MYDIVIIGSGSAGLSAAVYAKRAGKNTLVIEKDYEGAGQITLGGHVDNYLGLPGVRGMEMGEIFRKHAISLGAEIKEATVTNISKNSDIFEIVVDANGNTETLQATNIIFATGASHRNLGVPGEEELSGMGVSYCATCDGALYGGAEVIVCGGGDTAIDDALYLSEIASKVTLVHRRDEFRAAKASVDKLRAKENVQIITGVNIVKIIGEDEIEAVLLDNGDTINAEGLFIAVGMLPRTDLVKDLVELDSAGYIKANEDGRTSLKGLYVAGDVRTKELRQVVTAVADGANCVNSILQDNK